MDNTSGRKAPKLTTEQQDLLITCVEENPLLYDVRCRDHRNKLITTNTWKKFANQMDVEGLDWEQYKQKWKNIKDYFSAMRRKVKEAQRSGSGAHTVNKGQLKTCVQEPELTNFTSSYITVAKGTSVEGEVNADEDSKSQEYDKFREESCVSEQFDEECSPAAESQREPQRKRVHDTACRPCTSGPVSPTTVPKSRPKKRIKLIS